MSSPMVERRGGGQGRGGGQAQSWKKGKIQKEIRFIFLDTNPVWKCSEILLGRIPKCALELTSTELKHIPSVHKIYITFMKIIPSTCVFVPTVPSFQ